MPNRRRHSLGRLKPARFHWTVTFALLFLVTQAFAGGNIQPTNVAHGTAQFSQSGATTTIRASNNAIINYNKFNVAAGEAVKFVQPTATSRVLNRINSATPSQINGSLSANGIVYFVNPAGVMFGPNSIINVGQLYAAAGHITDSNFLGNINQFTANQGWVINQGSIYANSVTLAGQHVSNMGSIVAPDGLVTMVAGNDIFVGQRDSTIMVKVSGDAASTTKTASPDPGVENSGTISAPGGSVAIVAGDMYSLAIRHTGNTKAANVTLQGGKSGIVQAGGKIDASSSTGTGGTVQILGEKVALIGATIDASGATGGGTVLVGGDTHGQGNVPASSVTYVSADSTITADARGSGSGGKVVIWSDDLTQFYGNLYARGATDGNGGSAEVSSAGTLVLLPADINLGGGNLLLDPNAIIIQDASPDIDGAGLGHDITAATDLNLTTNFPGITSIITSTALNTILATTPVTLAAVNSISVNTSAVHINVGNGVTLTFDAPTLNLNDSITLTGTGSLAAGGTLTAVTVASPGLIQQGVNLAPASSSLNIAAGSYAENVSINKDLILVGPTVGAATATSWTTNVANTVGVANHLSATGDFLFNGPVTLTANTQLAATTFTFNNTITGAFNFDLNIPTINLNVPLPVAPTLTSNASTVNVNLNNLPVTPAGKIQDALTLAATNANINIAAGTYAEAVSVDKDVTLFGPTVGTATATSWTTNVANTVGLGNNLDAVGSFRFNGPVIITANTQLTAGTDVTINGLATGAFNLSILTPTVQLNAPVAIGGAFTGNPSTVNVNLNNLPITPAGRINDALSVAITGTNINLAAGVYFDDVAVNKDVSLLGPTIGIALANSWTTNALNTFTISGHLGSQNEFLFNGPVTLAGNTTLTGNGATFSGNTTGAFDLSLLLPVVNLNAPVNIGGTFSGVPSTVNVNLNNLPITPAGKIQDALTVAITGTTINIAAGSYAEAVSVDKNVTLLGPTTGTATATSWTTNVANSPSVGNHLGATGAFLFNGPLSLAADTVLTAGTSATFNGSVTGSFALTVDAPTVNLNAPINSTGTFSGTATAVNVDLDNLPITPAGKIQDAISVAATSGATINLAAGTYTEAVTVNKNLTILGPTVGTATATSWTTNLANTVALGNDLGATGAILLNGPSTLAANTFLTAGTTATINNTITGAFNLTLTAPAVNLNAPITVTTLSGTPTTVNVNLNNLPASPASPASPAGQIQDAVDVAATGATINLAAGSYVESVTVNKNVTLLGPTTGAATATSWTANVANTLTLGNNLSATGGFALNGPVLLTANTHLASTGSGNIIFGSTLDSTGSARTLQLDTAGTTSFGNTIGNTLALASLTTDAPGSTLFSSSLVKTTGNQSFNDFVTVGPGSMSFLTTAAGNVTFAKTLDGANNVTVTPSSGGATTFGSDVGNSIPLTSLTVTSAAITINGSLVKSTGSQNYAGPVTLGGPNTAFTSTGGGNITFGQTLNGSSAVAVNTSGVTTFSGDVGSGTPLEMLTTDSGGTTLVNASAITTNDDQTFNDPVTVGVPAITFTLLGSGEIGFTQTLDGASDVSIVASTGGSSIVFANAVGGTTALTNLTLNSHAGSQMNGGLVKTTGTQSYLGAVVMNNSDAQFVSTGGGNIHFSREVIGNFGATLDTAGTITFDAAVGHTFPLSHLIISSTGNTVINGGEVTTTGSQTYNNPVTVGAVPTHFSGGNVTFASTLDGASDVTFTTAGTTIFGGAVGGITPLASLTVDPSGTTAVHGGLIKTTGAQTYHDPVTLVGPSKLFASTSSGVISFEQALDGASNVTVTTTGSVIFGSTVGIDTALTSLTLAAPALAINGSLVNTTGSQDYAAPVTLGGPVTDFTSTGSGAITFEQTLFGPSAVSVNTAGATHFDSSVGSTTPLLSLTTDFPGTTRVTALVRTTGSQTFNDPVTISTPSMTFNSTTGGNLTFAQSVDGAADAAFNSSGTTTFNGAVGNSTTLLSLTTDAPGTTAVNTDLIIASGNLTFGDPVIVGAATTFFDSIGHTVHFNQSLNGAADVTVASAGDKIFDGPIGNSTSLNSIVVGIGGTININGGAVVTVVSQTYQDPVLLGAPSTAFISTSGQPILFAQTLDGASAVAINTAGTTTFARAVGGITPLTSLTTDSPGVTAVNGGLVKTTAGQIYGDPVTLGSASTLFNATSSGDIHFGQTLDGASAVTVTSAGEKIFNGPVGGTTPLLSLHVDAAQTITINGGLVKTVNGQLYDDPVVLGASATTFEATGGGDIHFAQTLDGASAVAVNTSGLTTFGGSVGSTNALTSLTTDAPGATAVNGAMVVTSGAQNFLDPVTIGNTATQFRSADADNIHFGQTLDGASDLQVTTLGTATFDGIVGGTTPLTRLSMATPGTTVFNTASVTTSADQTYGAVNIGVAAITFTNTTNSGQIAFLGALNGNAAVTINTAGPTILSAVGNTTPLLSLVTDAPGGGTFIRGDVVNTTGDQTFGDPVLLSASTTFTSTGTGNITFAQTIDGLFHLTVQTLGGGTTTFTGSVGGNTPLRSLTTDAPGTTAINGGLVRTTEGQTYNDTITLGQNTSFIVTEDGSIDFAKPFMNAVDLTLDNSAGTGSVTFNGPINVNNLVINSGRNITLMASATAVNDLSLQASLAAPRMTTSAGPGTEPSGLINLYGNLTATTIELNPLGMPQVPSVATIIDRDPNLTTFTAPTSFTMGQNEKLTALGALTINTGTATLSDMTVLGTLTVNATAINILTRAPGQLQANLPDGTTGLDQDVTNDPTKVETVDFVAADLAFPQGVVPVNVGSFTGAKYATPNGNGFVAGNAIRVFNKGSNTFGANLFTAANATVYDLKAEGPANTSVSSALAMALPQQLPMPNSVIGISTEDFETLLHAGVNARDVYTVEFVEGLIGRSLYNDIPTRAGSIIPSAERQTIDYKVAVTRLNYYLVQDLIATYHEIFDTPMLKDGKPVYKDGRVVYQDARKRPEMYRVFSAAVALYQTDRADEEFNPAAFAEYLNKTQEEPTSAAALKYLDQLRMLMGRIRALGLTPKDYQVAKSRLLTGLARGLTATQLEQVIDLTKPATKAATQGRP